MNRFKIHQPIELDYFRKGWEGSYRTRVEDILGNTISLGIPFVDGGGLLPVRPGETVTIRYWDQVASYTGTTVITEVRQNHLPVLKIAKPEQVERVQRREYVRIDVCLSIRFKVSNTEQEYEAKTSNVSGGGVAFYHNKPIEPGTILTLLINFNDFLINTSVQVVRVIWEETGKYQICTRFIELEHKLTDKIVSWVFLRQLRMRKRGLL